MTNWSVDVQFASKDALKEGDLGGWHRVSVLADDGDEAILLACQIVCSTHDNIGATATTALLRI